MFERILVPLDGSEIAESALPMAEEIGTLFAIEILLLHVCSEDCRDQERLHKIYLDKQAKTLEFNIRKVRPEGVTVEVLAKTEKGRPREIISNVVKKEKIDLVIMTSAGVSGYKAGVLGSVADHISRTLDVPALLVRPSGKERIEGPSRKVKQVLVPLDGSDLSKKALPIALELAKKLEAPLTLFRMVRDFSPYYGEAATFIDYQKLNADELKKVRSEVEGLVGELGDAGQKVFSDVTPGNDAAQEIIDMGKKLVGSLIVMSTHGRSGLARWTLGSVAERVLRYAGSPLLLVPARGGRPI